MNDINDYLEETEFENVYVIKKWNKGVIEKYLDLGCQLVGMFVDERITKSIPLSMLKNSYSKFTPFKIYEISDSGIILCEWDEKKIRYTFTPEDSKIIMKEFLNSVVIYFFPT